MLRLACCLASVFALALGCSEGPAARPPEASASEDSTPTLAGPAVVSAAPQLPAACNWDEGGRGGLPVCPNTGQPIPAAPVENLGCLDRGPDVVRWLGTEPVTPLAIVRGHRLQTAGQPCCSAWARTDRTWRAVGPLGEDLGQVEVEGGEGYDVTRCFELSMSDPGGHVAPWAYASRVPAQPRVSAWQPNADELASLEATLGGLATAISDAPADDEPVLLERSLFFEASDEFHPEPVRYALVGGHALVVARQRGDRFVVSHFDNTFTNVALSHPQSYRPVAALDMNEDGLIEVVYRWNEAASWGLVVLQKQYNDDWRRVAEDLGGATI